MSLDPRLLVAAAAALALAVLLGLVHHYRTELRATEAEYAGYKATVAAEAKRAEAETRAKEAQSKAETSNVQVRLDSALADNRRLLMDAAKARSGGSYLPSVPAGAGNADGRACFDRPQLDAALNRFGNGVAELAGEGSRAVIQRDAWHAWYDAQMKAWAGGK